MIQDRRTEGFGCIVVCACPFYMEKSNSLGDSLGSFPLAHCKQYSADTFLRDGKEVRLVTTSCSLGQLHCTTEKPLHHPFLSQFQTHACLFCMICAPGWESNCVRLFVSRKDSEPETLGNTREVCFCSTLSPSLLPNLNPITPYNTGLTEGSEILLLILSSWLSILLHLRDELLETGYKSVCRIAVFCTTFCLLKRHFLYHFVPKSHSSQKRNEEAESVPHLATFSVPHLGSFFGTQNVVQFLPLTVVQFLPLHFALCFPTCGTNLDLFVENQNLNWKSGGHIGGTISACWAFF